MDDVASVGETARRWGVSERYVQRLAAEGRVPGAQRYGNYWMLPGDAKKPPRLRRPSVTAGIAGGAAIATDATGEATSPAAPATPTFYFAADLPLGRPDDVAQGMDPVFAELARADLAYRRGDCEPAKRAWRSCSAREARLSAASLATAAAISSGDYALYNEVVAYLDMRREVERDPDARLLLSLPKTLAAVSMAAPNLAPAWLQEADFSGFSPSYAPYLAYLRVLYLRSIGSYAEMLGVASAALALGKKAGAFTWMDVYLNVLCACAATSLGEGSRADAHVRTAMDLGLTCGFIAPFADNLSDLGGRLDPLFGERYSRYRDPIESLWNVTFKNWMRFHNDFTREHVTTLLTLREYRVARLVAHGASYAQAAQQMSLSVSRIKGILAGVYAKLCIRGRSELAQFIR